MKYVLLGTLSLEGATRWGERLEKSKAKLAELGIRLESVYFTQGPYDFVDVVDAPDSESILAFSVWYVRQGFGRVATMPAFDEVAIDKALAKV